MQNKIKKYDCFISHASEDKEYFVRNLAKCLKKRGIDVWYDEYELTVGDSLRESIDKGLKNCLCGLVVLSKHFFEKNWTEYELNALVARQNINGDKIILPIWLDISKEDILKYSPSFADIYAIDSKRDLDDITKEILTKIEKLKKIKPQSQTIKIDHEDIDLKDLGYTFISRFETAFRRYLIKKMKILSNDPICFIPKGILLKIKTRVHSDDECEISDLLDYSDLSDLKEISLFNNSYNKFFPNSKMPKEQFIKKLGDLYELRCKIMHIRPFNWFDFESTLANIEKIALMFEGANRDLLEFIKNNKNSLDETIIIKRPKIITEKGEDKKIPNNVPIPDYEYDGGFIGRTEDIKELEKLLLESRFPIVTITGIGGVGKTALAIRTLEKIMKKEDSKFEYVIWTSAKNRELNVHGISEIEPLVKDFETFLDVILKITGFYRECTLEEKEADVNIIFEVCKVLIVIDNLETINDERIKNFLINYPPNVKFLITSRRGLGEIEKKYYLNELKQQDAIKLFRTICDNKKMIDLKKWSDLKIKDYTTKMCNHPLIIKWQLSLVAMGKNIDDITDFTNIYDNQEDVTKFFFEKIYKELSENAKRLLCVIGYNDESTKDKDLIYILGLDRDDFSDGIQELKEVSLITEEHKVNENNETILNYNLVTLTKGFIKNELDKNPNLKVTIQQQLSQINRTHSENRKASNLYEYSLANTGAVSKEERMAAVCLELAYRYQLSNNLKEMAKQYKTAKELAPNFPAVYINCAVAESKMCNYKKADDLMNKAVTLDSKNHFAWFKWGDIKKANNELEHALEYYEKANELKSNESNILNAIGYCKMRLGDYETANKYYLESFKANPAGSRTKHTIINKTSIAENLRRWAELYKKENNFQTAIEKLDMAIINIKEAYDLEKSDISTCGTYAKIYIETGYLYKHYKPDEKELYLNFFKKSLITTAISNKIEDLNKKAIGEIIIALRSQNKINKILEYVPLKLIEYVDENIPEYETIKKIFYSSIKQQHKIDSNYNNNARANFYNAKKQFGSIIKQKETFCIIKLQESEKTFLAPFSMNYNLSKINYSIIGRKIEFYIEKNNNKLLARNAKVLPKILNKDIEHIKN